MPDPATAPDTANPSARAAEVVLLRHAAYIGHRAGHHAHPDADLTPAGRAQAAHAATGLPGNVAAIVTSPLLRARRTAEIIAETAGLPLIAACPALAEWRAPSELFGLGPDDYPQGYRTWRAIRTARPESRYGDGESLTELYDRARTAAAWLADQATANGTLLAVSHAVLLRVLTRLPHGPNDFEYAAHAGWPLCTAETWYVGPVHPRDLPTPTIVGTGVRLANGGAAHASSDRRRCPSRHP